VGTDGIWDNIEANEMVEIINDYNTKETGTAIEVVLPKVSDNCISDGVQLDDMSLIISYL
jgi:serine/threonine protein phosphatase PrpC